MQQLKSFLKTRQRNSLRQNPAFAISKKRERHWWTPLWKGLVFDAESRHRQRMGAALWLYLYLLTCANRKSGTVHKKQTTIARETGYPLRTIQRHLHRLNREEYILMENSIRPPKIRIAKWKLFTRTEKNDK